MNKLNRDIAKSFRQIRDDLVAKYRNIFNDLKKNGIVTFDYCNWDRPRESDFKAFGADAKLYVQSLRDITVTKLTDYEINVIVDSPDNYTFVTKDELKKFETVTYPKLYAKWCEEQRQKRAAKRATNAKDATKIRAKIEKLQRQLKDLEA